MLYAFADAKVDFLLVGAHAVGVHGLARATMDMDLWVRPSPDNARRVMRALAAFRAPLHEVSEEDFIEPNLVFQIGIVPNRIDIMTGITGVEFADAWSRRTTIQREGRTIPVIGREELIRNKLSTGRINDRADVERLRALEE